MMPLRELHPLNRHPSDTGLISPQNILFSYQGITGNPSSLLLDALKKASVFTLAISRGYIGTLEGFSKGVTFT
jgi:hypothetical protein